MTRNEKQFVIVAATYVVVASAAYLRFRKTEEKKRAKIRSDAAKEIYAIELSAVRVKERIRQGHYTNVADVMTDYKFEQIAILNEEI